MPTSPPTAPFFVCTHHRCGTVLMRNVFERFAKRTSTRFFKGDPAEAPDDALIVHDAHSRSRLIPKNRGIHIFRDPFALLLSHVR